MEARPPPLESCRGCFRIGARSGEPNFVLTLSRERLRPAPVLTTGSLTSRLVLDEGRLQWSVCACAGTRRESGRVGVSDLGFPCLSVGLWVSGVCKDCTVVRMRGWLGVWWDYFGTEDVQKDGKLGLGIGQIIERPEGTLRCLAFWTKKVLEERQRGGTSKVRSSGLLGLVGGPLLIGRKAGALKP